MFPKSIDILSLPRTKAGNPKPRRRLLPGEKSLPSASGYDDPEDSVQLSSTFGASGDTHSGRVISGSGEGRSGVVGGTGSVGDSGGSSGVGGVFLDFGRSSARLKKVRRGWEWVYADEEDGAVKLEVGESCLLFPGLKDVGRMEDVPLQAVLSASTSYLSTIPELDNHPIIPEIISEQIVQSYNEARDPPRDVYKGHTVCVMNLDKGRIAKVVVAFPMGELGNHLNISPFLPKTNAKRDGKGVSRFVPTSKPIYRFPTEILQIASSPAGSSHRLDNGSTPLVVRLQYSTHLLAIRPNDSFFPPTTAFPVDIAPIATLSTADTEGRKHVDIALDPLVWGRMLVVDEGGGVWIWNVEWDTLGRSFEREMKLTKLRSATTTEPDQFFRISFGTQPDTALLLSNRRAILIDLNIPEKSTTLLHLRGADRFFTSLEKTACVRRAQYTLISTSQEVVWIDESLIGGGVALSWRHDYGGGKIDDLEVAVIEAEVGESVLLSSRSNPLIMVFSTTTSLPLRSRHPPFSLSLPIDEESKPLGSITRIQMSINSQTRKAPTLLIGQSADLGLWSTSLHTLLDLGSPGSSMPKIPKLKVRWSEDIQRMAGVDNEVRGEESWREKAKTKSRVMDCRWAWLKINEVSDGETFSAEGFETYLREIDAPLTHLTTAAELARDSVQTEESQVRSHLLHEITLRQRGLTSEFDALDNADLGKYLSIVARSDQSSVVSRLKELRETFSNLRNDLNIHRLALDLALSDVVLSSDSFHNRALKTNARAFSESPDDLFERAAGLSLRDREPPPIEFTFLPPSVDEIDEHDSRPDLQTLTARHLLSDWTVGSTTKDFRWKSWLDTGIDSTPRRPIRPLPSPRPRQGAFDSQPISPSQQRPRSQYQGIPMISSTQPRLHHPQPLRPTASVPLIKPSTPPHFHSSPPPVPPIHSQSGPNSQEVIFPSTQVERGPFGGKLGGEGRGKKKMGKKRVGGF